MLIHLSFAGSAMLDVMFILVINTFFGTDLLFIYSCLQMCFTECSARGIVHWVLELLKENMGLTLVVIIRTVVF